VDNQAYIVETLMNDNVKLIEERVAIGRAAEVVAERRGMTYVITAHRTLLGNRFTVDFYRAVPDRDVLARIEGSFSSVVSRILALASSPA
jgi:hypothetical protein